MNMNRTGYVDKSDLCSPLVISLGEGIGFCGALPTPFDLENELFDISAFDDIPQSSSNCILSC